MAYTSRIHVANFLGRDLTEHEIASLAFIIPAIKTWLDKRLNSTYDEATATTRYYDGGAQTIYIDPCTTITALKALNDDGTDSYDYTDGTEYIAEPQNETVKTCLYKRFGSFPHGEHRIAVTAIFSEYDEGVPHDIVLAATRLAAGILNAGKKAATGNIASESLEGHSISYAVSTSSQAGSTLDGIATTDPTVMEILEQRKDLYVDSYNPKNTVDYDDEGGLLA